MTDAFQDADRRRIEKRLLVAIFVVPVILGFFVNGYHFPVSKFLSEQLRGVFFSRFMLILLFIMEQTAVTLTVLLVWRPKGFAKPHGRVIAVLAMTTIAIFVSKFLYPWVFYSQWRGWVTDNVRLLLLTSATSVLTMFVLILVRRISGLSFVLDAATSLPTRKRLSILELMGWTTLVAVLAISVPPILREVDHLYRGYSSAVFELSLQVLWTCLPILFLASVSKLRWRYKIPLCCVATTLLAVGKHLIRARQFGWFPIQTQELVLQAAMTAIPVVLAFWLVQLRGYRVTVLGSKA